MAEQTTDDQVFTRLIEQVNRHVETRIEYLTLVGTEKISGLSSMLAGIFTGLIFGVIVLFFLSMGFAWWLGDLINSRAGGFAVAGLIFIPIAVVTVYWIQPFIRNKIIHSLIQEEKPKQPTTTEIIPK